MGTKQTDRKRNFTSFRKIEVFKILKLKELLLWSIDTKPVLPSAFLQEWLTRLYRHFDLESSEKSQELLIDAICDEALENTKRIKAWKAANLESKIAFGIADYLIAEKKQYLELPFACIVTAKKDDFEHGLTRCLIEMDACRWNNQQIGRNIDIFGIVTNGEGWKFYKLATVGTCYETPLYSLRNLKELLGILKYIFMECEKSLEPLLK